MEIFMLLQELARKLEEELLNPRFKSASSHSFQNPHLRIKVTPTKKNGLAAGLGNPIIQIKEIGEKRYCLEARHLRDYKNFLPDIKKLTDEWCKEKQFIFDFRYIS